MAAKQNAIELKLEKAMDRLMKVFDQARAAIGGAPAKKPRATKAKSAVGRKKATSTARAGAPRRGRPPGSKTRAAAAKAPAAAKKSVGRPKGSVARGRKPKR